MRPSPGWGTHVIKPDRTTSTVLSLRWVLFLTGEAGALLRPADNYGGRMAFFWVAPFGLAVALVFLVLFIRDKRAGGYAAVRLDPVGSARS